MIEDVLEVARNGERFLVACHRRPDADSLGSALGLIKTLRAIGKEATLFMPEQIPDSLLFLMDGRAGSAEVPAGTRFDATWVMDIAAKALLPPGFPASEVTGPVVIIDHHHAHDDVGDVVYRDTDSAATGEVVVRLIEELGLDRCRTGPRRPCMQPSCRTRVGFATRPRGRRRCAWVRDSSKRAPTLGRWPISCSSAGSLRGFACSRRSSRRSRMAFDGRVAIMRVTREMLEICGADDDMVEGMVNYARRVEGAEIGALLWEWQVRGAGRSALETKISLRSSGDADVSVIAAALNGGGHRAAAATQLDIHDRRGGERAARRARQVLRHERHARVVDKPAGCTSHDVVQRVRSAFGNDRSGTRERSTRSRPECWSSRSGRAPSWSLTSSPTTSGTK